MTPMYTAAFNSLRWWLQLESVDQGCLPSRVQVTIFLGSEVGDWVQIFFVTSAPSTVAGRQQVWTNCCYVGQRILLFLSHLYLTHFYLFYQFPLYLRCSMVNSGFLVQALGAWILSDEACEEVLVVGRRGTGERLGGWAPNPDKHLVSSKAWA